MTQQEVNRLIDLYMEGKTSPEEERQLAIEVNRPDAPAEWKIIAEMLGELTLGEALYDQTMAERKRVRIRRYIGWSIAAVAACLTLWFVLGKLSIPTLQQDTAPQIAQQPTPVVKPEAKEKEVSTVLTPASPAEEQVAYNAPTKRIKKHRKNARPVVEEVVEEEVPMLPEVSEEELAQVERNFQMWQLEQAFLVEQIELDAATAALNKQYKEYLAEARNTIEI
jgi:hypothetical protein